VASVALVGVIFHQGIRGHRPSSSLLTRNQIYVRGVVQGVGFRPFACTLPMRLGLTGIVLKVFEQGHDRAGATDAIEGSKTGARVPALRR